MQAIDALLDTLKPEFLRLPDELLATIPPRVPNNPKSREAFNAATGIVFDELAPAASSVALTLRVLLEPSRAARMVRHNEPGLLTVLSGLMQASWYARPAGGTTGLIQRQTNMQVLQALLVLAYDAAADNEVRALALNTVVTLEMWLKRQSSRDATWHSHYIFAKSEIERLRHDPAQIEGFVPVSIPPGSPIGSFQPNTLQ